MSKRIEKRREREELAAFLRARRERLSPEDVGLPPGVRRRTTGLRREEVARLSGVSTTWYTWLEQAKNIQVSAHFLERLAGALKLDSAEKKHLFLSCQLPLPERIDIHAIDVNEGLRRTLETISSPTFIHTLESNLAYMNTAAVAVWGNLSWMPPRHRNALRVTFLDQRIRAMLIDWHRRAPKMVARFRLDAAAVLTDPDVVELIEELKREKPGVPSVVVEPGGRRQRRAPARLPAPGRGKTHVQPGHARGRSLSRAAHPGVHADRCRDGGKDA